MLYSEAISWIENIERSGSDYGLERERELLDLLGSPDKNLKIVHVAGTNGKGSVCAFLTTACVGACLKTGTYNSPSVFDYSERFLLNGESMNTLLIAKYMSAVRETIENEQKRRIAYGNSSEFKPTAFEIETAVALLAFSKEKCDAVILETGLGGRWDATNAIKQKDLSIITTIGLDHCQLLGNTLCEIAAEKADIITCDAVTSLQHFDVMKLLTDKCAEKGGDLIVASEPVLIAADFEGQVFEYKDKQYSISLLGKHQLTNAAIAIEALCALIKKGWKLTEDDIRFGLNNTVWHARFEVLTSFNNGTSVFIPSNKMLILDGGHNPQGAAVLADCIRDYLGGMRVHLIIGVLADKDYQGILKELVPLATRITAVASSSTRALPAETLMAEIEKLGGKADSQDNIALAVQKALAEWCDVVILCGSLTLFKSIKKSLHSLDNRKLVEESGGCEHRKH